MSPLDFFNAVREAACLVAYRANVVFRDADGTERPVAKVKIRGRETIIICERDDG